eukprot:jgi/Bigna1/126085/aug1.2_g793
MGNCYCCLNYYQKRDLVLNAFPCVRVGDAKVGEAVKVVGWVTTQTPLNCPVTPRQCVFYHLKVQEHWKDGDENRSKTIKDEKRKVDFYLCSGDKAIFIRSEPFVFISKDHQKRDGPPGNQIANQVNQAIGGDNKSGGGFLGAAMGAFAEVAGESLLEAATGRKVTSEEWVTQTSKKVAILGLLKEKEGGGLELVPMASYNLSDNFMDNHNWDDNTRQAWTEVMGGGEHGWVTDKHIARDFYVEEPKGGINSNTGDNMMAAQSVITRGKKSTQRILP